MTVIQGRRIDRVAVAAAIVGVVAIWVIATQPVVSVVGLVAGGTLVVLGLLRPALFVMLIAVAVPFGTLRQVSAAGLTMTAADPLVGLLLVTWLARSAARREFRINWTLAGAPLAVFVLFAVFSATTAGSLSDGLTELVKWIEFAIVFWFVSTEIDGGRWRMTILVTLLAAVTAEAALGWYQFATQSGPAGFVVLERFLRAFGNFGQPNPFAGYVNTGLLLVAGVLLGGLVRDWRRLRTGWTVPLAAIGVVMAGAVAMSFSRAAWLAAAAGLCAMIALGDRRSLKYFAAGLVVISLTGFLGAFELLPSFLSERLTGAAGYFGFFDARSAVLTAENYPLVERMATWQAAWEMFRDHPLVGVGIGNFNEMYQSYALPGWVSDPGHAHNIVLNTLAEMGVAGLAALTVFLGAQLLVILQALRVARDRFDQDGLGYGIVLGVLGAWTAVAVHNLFDNLYVSHIYLQMAILLGLAAAIGRKRPEELKA